SAAANWRWRSTGCTTRAERLFTSRRLRDIVILTAGTCHLDRRGEICSLASKSAASGGAAAPRAGMAPRSGRRPCPHSRPRHIHVPLAPSPPASLRPCDVDVIASVLRISVLLKPGTQSAPEELKKR